jgi:membrane protein required for colicin V production
MLAGVSYLDLALVAAVVISGLVAMYRGLTREVLSIVSWLAAAGAAFYVIRFQTGWAAQLAKMFAGESAPTRTHVIIAQIVIGTAIFLVVLIVVHLITSHISNSVLDSRVGAIDRVLGLGFGALRGFILIVIPYMFAMAFVCQDGARSLSKGCKPEQLPVWVEKAQSRDVIDNTGRTLFDIFQQYVPQQSQTSG